MSNVTGQTPLRLPERISVREPARVPRVSRSPRRAAPERPNVGLTPATADGLERYFQLLTKWNEKINLTAFRLQLAGSDESIDRLLIEPLIAAAYLPANARQGVDIRIWRWLACDSAQADGAGRANADGRVQDSKGRVPARGRARASGWTGCRWKPPVSKCCSRGLNCTKALDLVTIRAVRVEARTLVSLQAFLRPGGRMFLFRGSGGADLAKSITPPLSLTATYPLVDSLGSQLVVLTKSSIGRR